ncbi:MAG: hypothetical protein LUH20_09095 [Lachnospiraceae bacterium]|nr:hypothetical protein [Lachnospiraceae bacterium]MCD7832587.1 hypothetical protein [Lachnospiraceae bacterium]
MPEANNETQRFYQNLVDIGFGEEMIARCVLLQKEGRERELRLTLQNSRRNLLDQIHTEQKKLDCLDYLVNWLDKKGAKKS